VDDAGRVINPMIVDGQTHGGIAQGIGQALYETIDYDPESGQPNGGTFMTYAMPRADHVPMYDLELVEDRTAGNPLSIKGGGEAGVTPSPAVIINAICQAFEDYGVTDVPMPATPETLWRLMQSKALRVAVPA
jgi:carbon-monoxide dehydrogenase large subunit